MAKASAWARLMGVLRGLFGVRSAVPMIRLPRSAEVGIVGAPLVVNVGTRESHYLVDPVVLRDLVAKHPEARYGLDIISSQIAGREVRLSMTGPDGELVDLPDTHPAMVFMRTRIKGYTLHQYVQRQLINLHFGAFCAEIRGRPSPVAPDVALLIPHDPEDVNPLLTDDETQLVGFQVTLPTTERKVVPERFVFGSIAPILGGVDRFTGVSPFYSLLPYLESAAKDATYLRDKPRGSTSNIKIAASLPASEMAPVVESIVRIRESKGVTIQPKDFNIEALRSPSETDDIETRLSATNEQVTLTLGLAPVVMNQSVTNDSAAKVQQDQMFRHMQSLTQLLWAQHEPLLRLLARPGEMAAGLHFRTDWSDVIQARSEAAEAASIDVDKKRADLFKTYTDAGVPLLIAADLAGVDLSTEAPDGQDRTTTARAARRGLRALPSG